MKKATKKEMRAEALERMKILKLDGETIEKFEKEKRLTISEQRFFAREGELEEASWHDMTTGPFRDVYPVHDGIMWSLWDAAPARETLDMVKAAEKEYGVIVYHIQRLECRMPQLNPDGDVVLYGFLCVSQYPEEWEESRRMAEMGMPECVAPVYGYGGYEFSSLPVKSMGGCVLRIA